LPINLILNGEIIENLLMWKHEKATKRTMIKFERKTIKEDEIWFFKKIIPNKIIAIKRMNTKFERLKNHRRWNWKTFLVCTNKIKMQKDNKKKG
jgi:hypothetical protein